MFSNCAPSAAVKLLISVTCDATVLPEISTCAEEDIIDAPNPAIAVADNEPEISKQICAELDTIPAPTPLIPAAVSVNAFAPSSTLKYQVHQICLMHLVLLHHLNRYPRLFGLQYWLIFANVTPLSLILSASELISIVESSTFTSNSSFVLSATKPAPAITSTSISSVISLSLESFNVNVPPVFKPSPAVIVIVESLTPAKPDTCADDDTIPAPNAAIPAASVTSAPSSTLMIVLTCVG